MSENIMSETIPLGELQIKRRELENELASLSKTERMLENDLKKLEARIIEQLKAEIQAKKSALNGLESRKTDLEKKLTQMQGKTGSLQSAGQPPTSGEIAEPFQQDETVGANTEVAVVEYQQE
jgi:chromosome segregation ATPase